MTCENQFLLNIFQSSSWKVETFYFDSRVQCQNLAPQYFLINSLPWWSIYKHSSQSVISFVEKVKSQCCPQAIVSKFLAVSTMSSLLELVPWYSLAAERSGAQWRPLVAVPLVCVAGARLILDCWGSGLTSCWSLFSTSQLCSLYSTQACLKNPGFWPFSALSISLVIEILFSLK